MKKLLGMLGLVFGLAVASYAGTPQEAFYSGQAPLSGVTIFASTASATSLGGSTFVLTVTTPTVINSGGSSYSGRNCFTNFMVQMSSAGVFTLADNSTTKMTIYGTGLTTTGVATKDINRDHLGPICTSIGNQSVFTITFTGGNVTPASINVDGYTTYGGTTNAGPMN